MGIDKNHLSQEQFEVTQNCGTEPPFSGKLLYEKREGIYSCVVCDFSLFESKTKFESGTGWPSFYEALDDTITTKDDNSHGMKRTEITCSNCDSHLGHVFPDGPRPTGLRYCVNSLSLNFNEDE
ncbi:MAG: peptide-methionine (R)-S-oxide reductase [Actinobacteria bacterium]|nr:peptide-methionine (R)-S-oxide reductase [Actinomycetota bacterium]|tara:strand:- start:794 stop:1165 length:372 start_codon:yes stop_codon:yes gene_type:complete